MVHNPLSYFGKKKNTTNKPLFLVLTQNYFSRNSKPFIPSICLSVKQILKQKQIISPPPPKKK